MPTYIAVKAKFYLNSGSGDGTDAKSYQTTTGVISCSGMTDASTSPIGVYSSQYTTRIHYKFFLDSWVYVNAAEVHPTYGDPATGWTTTPTGVEGLDVPLTVHSVIVPVTNPWVYEGIGAASGLGGPGTEDNQYVSGSFEPVTGTDTTFGLPFLSGTKFRSGGSIQAKSFLAPHIGTLGCTGTNLISALDDWQRLFPVNLASIDWGITYLGQPTTLVAAREAGAYTKTESSFTPQASYRYMWLMFEGVATAPTMGLCFLEETATDLRDFKERFPE